jgi:hypothetical protein
LNKTKQTRNIRRNTPRFDLLTQINVPPWTVEDHHFRRRCRVKSEGMISNATYFHPSHSNRGNFVSCLRPTGTKNAFAGLTIVLTELSIA